MNFRLIMCLVTLTLFSSSCGEVEQRVTIENAADSDFASVVEIPLSKIKLAKELEKGESYLILNEQGDTLPSQMTYDEKLIFQVTIPAHSAQRFTITQGEPQPSDSRVFGRQFPERYDDFAWENDRVGFRFYGKALKAIQAPTNGLDLWYKRTPHMVLADWYRKDISKEASYHVDHGEGCDPYGVGPTLGAGAMAPYIDGQLLRNENYESYEILDNGPLRITAKLIYPKLHIHNKKTEDIRIVSLDAGSQFTKITQRYGEAGFTVAAGIVKRPEDDSILVSADNRYLIYVEPMSAENGQIYLSLVFENGFDKSLVDTYIIGNNTYSHTLAVKEYKGEAISYYTGFGWDKFGFENASQFEEYVKIFTERLSHPIVIKY